MTIELTDQWKRKEARLVDYLCSLVDECKEGYYKDCFKVIHNALILWQKLRAGISTYRLLILEVPDCYPNDDDNIVFTWNKDEHYLKCEILVDGTTEFFYRNHLTKEIREEDYNLNDYGFPDSVYDETLLNKLSYFVE